ncbi:hypothetical protein B0O99DRAFT_346276 [Bisporella sp. PMI_857]|nr:hypothetical protein B0O99DRAFT_346276 [Bisporella sp. PMI_857]
MSFLTASHHTSVTAVLPPTVKKYHVLRLLHDTNRMVSMSPIVTAHKLLPASSSTAFYAKEPAEYRPRPEEAPFPVYEVTETMGEGEEGGGSWRGGWAKRFIPESITYETGLQTKEDGLVCITHAGMGVHSVTTWTIREEDGKLVLDEKGVVTSNRMLMSFIKTTLQESHEKLVRDVVALLEQDASDEKAPAISPAPDARTESAIAV